MKYPNRAAAPAHLRTKTELQQARLKPVSTMFPAGQYWQGFRYIALYDPATCVPMRPRRQATPLQAAALTAGRTLTDTARCVDCGQRHYKWLMDRHGRCGSCLAHAAARERQRLRQALRTFAAGILAREPLFLDLETTGLDEQAEIVEIALLDVRGAVLLETLVKPSQPMPEAARQVHGISDQDLSFAPSWPALHARVAAALSGRLVIAHNAAFERRMLRQTAERHQMPPARIETECTMVWLTELNDGRWPSLADAVDLAGAARAPGPWHRAKADAETCRQIVLALADGASAAQPAPAPF